MEKMTIILNRIMKGLIVISIGAVIFVVNLQVFSRYIFNKPLPWPEEAASILVLWSGYLSAAYVFQENGHIAFDFLINKLHTRMNKYINLVNHILMGIFLIGLVVYGTISTIGVLYMKTAALRISRSIVFAAIPLSAFLMSIFNFQKIFELLKKNQ